MMKKADIKIFIEIKEKELAKLQRKTRRMQRENEKSKELLYDLSENYLREERLEGQIESARLILNYKRRRVT